MAAKAVLTDESDAPDADNQHCQYELVGDGTPVFFIGDPQKFPDFIHSPNCMADFHADVSRVATVLTCEN
jgi:hypothetical protein